MQEVMNVTCAVCNTTFVITATKEGYDRWLAGELIQDALPELTVEERELLISQTCSPCFDNMFDLPE